MKHRLLAFLVAALAGVFVVSRQPRAVADTEVKVAPGSVRIDAATAPVSAVLDQLAKSTGMKIVYEGPPPSDRVSAAIEAKSETEAISRLLEGLGLTYAFKLDASGHRVETLFISTTTTSSTRRTSSSAPPPRRAPEPMEDIADEGEPMVTDTPPDPAGDPGAPQPEAPGGNMGGGMVGGQGVPTYDPAQPSQQPSFPGAASYPSYPSAPGVNPTFPGNPTFPARPVMPGPYSYPSPNN